MSKDNIKVLPQADVERLNLLFLKLDWGNFFWGFTCLSRQNYARTVRSNCVNQIMLGIQCNEGGCLCELAIRWHMLTNVPVARLEVFDEAWTLFQTPTFAAVLENLTQMCKNHTPTPDEVSTLLIVYGFTDQSDRLLVETDG